MLAEALHLLRLTLPPELAEAFSYFSQAGAPKCGRGCSSRRSRKSIAGGGAISPAPSAAGLEDDDKDAEAPDATDEDAV